MRTHTHTHMHALTHTHTNTQPTNHHHHPYNLPATIKQRIEVESSVAILRLKLFVWFGEFYMFVLLQSQEKVSTNIFRVKLKSNMQRSNEISRPPLARTFEFRYIFKL